MKKRRFQNFEHFEHFEHFEQKNFGWTIFWPKKKMVKNVLFNCLMNEEKKIPKF